MLIRRSPEEALNQLLMDLKNELRFDPYDEIVPAGSIALGTYVENPDIDIFILTPKKSQIMRGLQRAYPFGHEKVGELTIWNAECYGYDVDFVMMEKGDEKVQTLKHVEHYKKLMTPEKINMVKELKRLFKRINCYSAETGGITGICLTELAMKYDTIAELLASLIIDLKYSDECFVEDPTLKGRNLFASVTKNKRKLMLKRLLKYPLCEQINEGYMTYTYKTLKIRRKLSMGTDREFQQINNIINKQWNLFSQKLKFWNPSLEYDILVLPLYIWVGVNTTPCFLDKDNYKIEHIPKNVLNERAMEALRKIENVEEKKDEFAYTHYPPVEYVNDYFVHFHLIPELEKIYIDIELN